MQFLVLLCVYITLTDRRKCSDWGDNPHYNEGKTLLERLLYKKTLQEPGYTVNRKCSVNVTYKTVDIISLVQ